MARTKNLIPAAAVASSSTTEGPLQLLKDLNIRLVAETVELRKQIKLLKRGNLVSTDSGRGAVDVIKRDGRPAAICAADPQMEEAYLDAEKSNEAEKTAAPVKEAAVVETPEVQEGNADCTVVPLLPDLIAGKASAGIGREVEEAVDRKWMESTADLDERFVRVEERLVKLEEEGERRERRLRKLEEEGERRERKFRKLEEEDERRERLLFSAMEEGFRKFEEEGERRETMLMKLEEEDEGRDRLLCSSMEEVVLLKNHSQEEKNSVAVDLAAGKKKSGWIKWIPAAIFVAVGVAVVAKSSK